MESNPIGRSLLFCVMYILNIGVWTHNFSVTVKIGYAILVGIVTILGAVNQWNTFYKTYHTVWVVVKINHAITWILPRKKGRHHKNNISHTKQDPLP